MRFKKKQFLIKCLSEVTAWIVALDYIVLFIQLYIEMQFGGNYDTEVFVCFAAIGIMCGLLFPNYYKKKSGEEFVLSGDQLLLYLTVIFIWISIAWTSYTFLKVFTKLFA